MKTSLLPATRVDPRLRQRIEALLEEGETLSAFIESAVLNQANWRDEQRAFIERGLEAEAGDEWVEHEVVIAVVRTASLSRRRRS